MLHVKLPIGSTVPVDIQMHTIAYALQYTVASPIQHSTTKNSRQMVETMSCYAFSSATLRICMHASATPLRMCVWYIPYMRTTAGTQDTCTEQHMHRTTQCNLYLLLYVYVICVRDILSLSLFSSSLGYTLSWASWGRLPRDFGRYFGRIL